MSETEEKGGGGDEVVEITAYYILHSDKVDKTKMETKNITPISPRSKIGKDEMSGRLAGWLLLQTIPLD